MSVVEIVSDTATIVEVVIKGPQGPAGAGSFNKPLRLPAGSYSAADGDQLIMSGTSDVTLPDAAASVTGITIRADGGTVTLIPTGTDTIEVTTITDGQSVQHGPALGEWIKL